MFEFQNPCEDFAESSGSDVSSTAAVSDIAGSPQPRLPMPRNWSPSDYSGIFDAATLAELQASAASGDGIRTLYGNTPPPPGNQDGNDSGGRGEGNGGFLLLLGAIALTAAFASDHNA